MEADRATSKVPWQILLVLGLVILPVATAELYTILVPTDFGNQTWEFGTTSGILDHLPLFGLGISIIMVSAVALGIRWLQLLMVTLLIFIVLSLLALGAISAINLPVVLKAIPPQGPRRVGGLKYLAKTASQFSIYTLGLGILVVVALRIKRVRA